MTTVERPLLEIAVQDAAGAATAQAAGADRVELCTALGGPDTLGRLAGANTGVQVMAAHWTIFAPGSDGRRRSCPW